jgi:hypothetical protein
MARSRKTVALPILSAPEIPLYDGDMEADLALVGRNRLADRITGGLSFTSKMPCPSWGISAIRCRTGQRLAQVLGTTCHDCYALKGRYIFPNVQRKLEERYEGLFHSLWTPAMLHLFSYFCARYFRLFDSGDLQGVNHLKNILTIARNVPDVQMWLPTREYEVVQACADEIPPNLTIRVSAHQVDAEPPSWWPTTSTVTHVQETGNRICPAPDQDGRCGECRECWDRSVKNVAYRLH